MTRIEDFLAEVEFGSTGGLSGVKLQRMVIDEPVWAANRIDHQRAQARRLIALVRAYDAEMGKAEELVAMLNRLRVNLHGELLNKVNFGIANFRGRAAIEEGFGNGK